MKMLNVILENIFPLEKEHLLTLEKNPPFG